MNVFPVTVVSDGVKIGTRCRAVGGPAGTVTVWQWAGGGPVVLVEGTGVSGVNPRTWTADTDGGEVTISRESGCGCSHPLKRWRPEGAAHREHA